MRKDFYISDDEIAERLGIDRSSVTRMIRKYMDNLTEYGNVLIEKEKQESGAPIKNYLLTTEWQYYLLVMYARPTEKACKEKLNVVKNMFQSPRKE